MGKYVDYERISDDISNCIMWIRDAIDCLSDCGCEDEIASLRDIGGSLEEKYEENLKLAAEQNKDNVVYMINDYWNQVKDL